MCLSSKGCWETLSRLCLPITPTKLRDDVQSSELLLQSSQIYGRLPVPMDSVEDVTRSILKVMLCLERGAVRMWEVDLWDLWCMVENPNSLAASTREQVFAPLLEMAQRVIWAWANEQTSCLAAWLASRLTHSLVSFLPATQSSASRESDEARSPILFGWEKLAEESNRRHLSKKTEAGACIDTHTYICIWGSQRVEVHMVSLPGPELMTIVVRNDQRYAVWHDLQSRCSAFVARMGCWIRQKVTQPPSITLPPSCPRSTDLILLLHQPENLVHARPTGLRLHLQCAGTLPCAALVWKAPLLWTVDRCSSARHCGGLDEKDVLGGAGEGTAAFGLHI